MIFDGGWWKCYLVGEGIEVDFAAGVIVNLSRQMGQNIQDHLGLVLPNLHLPITVLLHLEVV